MVLDLDAALRSVCPSIDGVSIGNVADRSSWRVWFSGNESEDQRQAALVVLATFDPIESLKRELEDAVQSQFDALVGAIVTPGAAMANVYRVQVDAAYRMKAGLIATHPAIAALVGTAGLGATEAEVANTIAARNEQCEVLIAGLNAKRLAAKSAIMEAQNEAAARAAAVVDWDA